MKYTNKHNVPISLALWLAHDEYDYNDDPNHFSATDLLRPIKQLVLAQRVKPEDTEPDVAHQVASRIGTAIHNAIENSWMNHYQKLLKILGYPDKLISRIKINPKKEELKPDTVPVYLEQRVTKQIDGFNISGKFDFVIEGAVRDFKKTKTYSYGKIDHSKYQKQGSIYRWLNPEIITSENMYIDFIFTDWMASKIKYEKNYPPTEVLAHPIKLMSIAETEQFVRQKIAAYKKYAKAEEKDIPDCTKEDLWQSDSVFKYFKDPNKTSRSTKNFDNYHDAHTRLLKDGNVGMIQEVPGKVKACKYCPAASVCKQKDQYILNGTLEM